MKKKTHPDSVADALNERQMNFRDYYDKSAESRDQYIRKNSFFYEKLAELLNFIIEPDKNILYVGSQTGAVLSRMAASKKVGVEVSKSLVEIARRRHPEIEFHCQPDNTIDVGETFDYVILSSLGDLSNPPSMFDALKHAMTPDSRLIIHTYSHFWEPVLKAAEWFGMKFRLPAQNWITSQDLSNFLPHWGYETLKIYRCLLMPKYVPVLSWFANQVVAKLPLINRLCLIYIVVARPLPPRTWKVKDLEVSVVIPCKDEEKNIEPNVRRIPEMGKRTEIIFCDDNSSDGTRDEILRVQKAFPERRVVLHDAPGIGKATAVWEGFDKASGDLLIILDADLTTLPEELPEFVRVMSEGGAELINSSRLVYAMEEDAMRPLNLLGNRFFSRVLTFIVGQRITDPLAAVKILWRKDWPRIRKLIGSWGVEDRWGDFDLLFSAAKLHLKIAELPVHYVDRVSGETKMKRRLRNGLLMLRMCIHAFFRFNRY